MFVWGEEDLNTEQSNSIRENGSVYLVACPGSGKTRTLTYKIAKELTELNSTKSWIVAITYTNRAADEIKERIELLGVDISQLWIGTIHSFCLEWIIKPYGAQHPSLEFGYRVIDSYDSEQLLDELCKPYSRQKITYYDCQYFFTTQGITYSCDPKKREIIRSIINSYHEILLSRNQIDFEQILYFAHQLIISNPTISKTLSNLFSFLLIDEFQDTREIQYSIFGEVIRKSNSRLNAFIVGDPNQAIFGSLGGYAITIEELNQISGQTFKLLGLTKNYRSSSKIVSHFSNYKVFDSDIVAAGEHSNYPTLVSYVDNVSKQDLASHLAEKIKYHISVENIDESEVCIIAPWWIHIASITRALSSQLPEYSFNGPGLTPFFRDEENFWYKLSKLILTEPSPSLYTRRIRWASEILEMLQNYDVSTINLKPKLLLRFINSLHIEIDDGLQHLADAFELISQELKVDFKSIAGLKEHYDAFFENAKKRIENISKENVEYAGSIDNFRNVFKRRNGIAVSTIHGIKGAEFDVVIAYGLLQGIVPHFNDKDPHSAHKLLYVIGSRARKHLHLISETGRGTNFYPKWPTNILAEHVFEYDDPIPFISQLN